MADLKIGDLVRIIKIPGDLPFEDIALLTLALGRPFPITDLDYGLVTLEIGEVVNDPPYTEIVSLQPEYVEIV